MLKSASIAVAVLIIAVAVPGPAAAQDQSGICSIANTCSEAFFQCVATRCPVVQDAPCTAACKAQFNGCMTTGAFAGRDCRGKTLMRK